MSKFVPIRVDIFERAFKRYQKTPGASFTALAKKMKVPVAHLRDWRHRGEVPEDKLELLAQALNTPAGRLVRTPDGALAPESDAGGVILPNKVGHNLLTVAKTFRSYTKFLGYHRTNPQYPHHHSIHHVGNDSFYGTLFLEGAGSKQEWLFSIWFGLRVDYGYVRMNNDLEVSLEPILQEQDPNSLLGFAAENEDGKAIVSVRTWFGRASCDFIIQSDKPFELRWTREPIAVPGTVTFLKNPFRRED